MDDALFSAADDIAPAPPSGRCPLCDMRCHECDPDYFNDIAADLADLRSDDRF